GSSNACEKTSFAFLRQELPVRLSNIMKEINLLPDRVLRTPSVQLVQSWYVQSLLDIMAFLDRDPEDQATLGQAISPPDRPHPIPVPLGLRSGFYWVPPGESRPGLGLCPDRVPWAPAVSPLGVSPGVSVVRVGSPQLVVPPSSALRRQHEPCAPQTHWEHRPPLQCGQRGWRSTMMPVRLLLLPAAVNSQQPVSIVYVPSHLYHMLFELFKNAMRATVESHESSPRLPAIKVMVALGQEDLSIRMSDRGMGVPLRKIERLFSYMYSTAPTPQMGTGGTPL
ncbi:PDK2 kinase, partial [Oxyruncus cristatus]|nr:PDK2 kinase [Oxyruncus cristatus]